MIDFIAFIVFLGIGYGIRPHITKTQQALLKRLAYHVLLIFVVASLWLYGLPEQSWRLVFLGGLLQLAPTIIGSLQGNTERGRAFLLFSTFGGGNRGTLALSLLSPTLLPVFVLIDLGNFLSLILFYPQLVSMGLRHEKDKNIAKSNLVPLLISLTILIIGFALHQSGIGLENGIAPNLHYALKLLLIALTSLQIGIYLTLDSRCLIWTLQSMVQVRLVALITPLVFAFLFIPDAGQTAIPVLLLFASLPVGSLVVSLLPTQTNETFQQQLACAVTASTLIFLMILGGVAASKFLL